jgi:dipeptidyl aminopeptidase/acylaminoacyl peptidase
MTGPPDAGARAFDRPVVHRPSAPPWYHAAMRAPLRSSSSVALVLALAAAVAGQSPPGGGWLRPPEPVARLVESPPPPDASLSPQRTWLTLRTREPLPGLDVIARPHLKLAGQRVDPAAHGPELAARTLALALVAIADGKERPVAIPPGHWTGPIWSADDRAFALVRAADGGGELWVADPATAPPRRIANVRVNAVLAGGVQWLPDQRRLLVHACAAGAAPERPLVPSGPQVQAAQPGEKAPVRTYQDLLQDAHDEALFEHYGQSQLLVVDPAAGGRTMLGPVAMWERVEPSPDGALFLATRIERPFSYLHPRSAFPRTVEVLDRDGRVVRTVAKSPLQDKVPIGGVPTGPRSVGWSASLPHALVWIEALDGGDPKAVVAARDAVFRLDEPDGEPLVWFRTEHRATGIQFGSDGALALATEFDRRTRRSRLWRFDARDAARPGVLLAERSTQDAYGDPGSPVMERRPDGRALVRMVGEAVFLAGDGASPQGSRPFVDRWDLASGHKDRFFHAEPGRHEQFVGFLDERGLRLLVRSESRAEPPALVVVDLAAARRTPLRAFADPAGEALRGVQKRILTYARADGVQMSGTLYLPPGHDGQRRPPCLIWAYPVEFTQASDAGQVRAAPDRWLRPGGSSHLALLLAGYAVLDDASMPIVGPQRSANDTFVEQLQQNARAAVDALTKDGAVDTTRLAVAGHSYGAFMTANLLAHTDLFRCGIARSGAYNRTLTPFGFQNEDRTYWDAPEVYDAMSPFRQAHRIGEPLLLIHGADDDNPGTFPLQSQRMFAALKGNGGHARLCMLPHESHGYAARENVLQCLAEMCAWLDAHCRDGG